MEISSSELKNDWMLRAIDDNWKVVFTVPTDEAVVSMIETKFNNLVEEKISEEVEKKVKNEVNSYRNDIFTVFWIFATLLVFFVTEISILKDITSSNINNVIWLTLIIFSVMLLFILMLRHIIWWIKFDCSFWIVSCILLMFSVSWIILLTNPYVKTYSIEEDCNKITYGPNHKSKIIQLPARMWNLEKSKF